MNMPFYLIFYNFHNKTIHYFFINAHGGGMSYFNIINSRFRIRYLYRSIIICADTDENREKYINKFCSTCLYGSNIKLYV